MKIAQRKVQFDANQITSVLVKFALNSVLVAVETGRFMKVKIIYTGFYHCKSVVSFFSDASKCVSTIDRWMSVQHLSRFFQNWHTSPIKVLHLENSQNLFVILTSQWFILTNIGPFANCILLRTFPRIFGVYFREEIPNFPKISTNILIA